MKRFIRLLFVISFIAGFLVGCSSNEASNQPINAEQQGSVNEEEDSVTESQQRKEVKGKTEKEEAGLDLKEAEDAEQQLDDGKLNQNPSPKIEHDATNEQAANTEAKTEAETKTKIKTNTEAISETTRGSKEESKQATAQEPPVPATHGNDTNSNEKTAQKAGGAEELHEVSIFIHGDDQLGVILKETRIAYVQGDTVLDILKKATKQSRIQMEYRGRGGTAYVEGIQNLYEFDNGPKSGWMYSVNGTFMNKSAGVVEVNGGDKIEWLYTEDLGNDLGANRNE